MNLFEKQVIQIASLGVWQIVTDGKMKRRLNQVKDSRWDEKTGLFVTLRKDGKLRGNIGMLESTSNLAETLFDVGANAATHDQRFPPVRPDELSNLEIEVTLLSTPEKLKLPTDIVIGNSGLIISRGEKRGVLLPQVATENKWSAEQFLEACCEKAQLSHKAWLDPNTLVEVFQSQVLNGGLLLPNIKELI